VFAGTSTSAALAGVKGSIETMHNPKYPLELFLRVMTVSLETMKIVNALPGLVIEGDA